MNIYNFKVKNISGETVNMSDFKDKVLLIVNTATQCGFTHQYSDLQDLYKKYADKGLEILSFPCNQFANQAPQTSEQIASFTEKRYGVKFHQFEKILVNPQKGEKGEKLQENDLFAYLKRVKKGVFGTKMIKWNFTKFIVDRNGKVVYRIPPFIPPYKLENKIVSLLNQSASNSL